MSAIIRAAARQYVNGRYSEGEILRALQLAARVQGENVDRAIADWRAEVQLRQGLELFGHCAQ